MLNLPGALAADAIRLLRTPSRHPSKLRGSQRTALLASLLDCPPEALAHARWEEVDTGTSSRWRIHLQPAGDSWFAKANAQDFATRLFGGVFRLGENELAFYRHVGPHVEVLTPAFIGGQGNRFGYLLLLEDLVGKARFGTVAEDCDLPRAEAAMITLAHLHASAWQSPRFEGGWSWVNRVEYGRHRALMSVLRPRSIATVLSHHRDRLTPTTESAARYLRVAYPQIEAAWSAGARTLVHGDAHLGNMYFTDGKCGLLDWQVVGFEHGMRDVTYFLINSLSTGLRRAHQDALLSLYVNALRTRNIDFDLGRAQQQYILHVPYAWVAAVFTVAFGNLQRPEIALSALSRSSQALADLEVVERLSRVIPG